MAGYEATQIVGNLGSDPELRYTQQGKPVCNFSVAVDTSYTDSDGQRHERVKWYRVTVWNAQAEVCAEYLNKGSQAFVVGTVDTSAYTTRDGQAAASLDLTAQRVVFLSGGQQASGDVPLPEADGEQIPF